MNQAQPIKKIDKLPPWATPDKALSPEDVELFNNANYGIPPNMEFEGEVLEASIVTRGDGDLIFQFRNIKHPDFRNLLAEVVEEHFGSTEHFKVDWASEIKVWGLLAKDVRTQPFFNLKHFTEDFLWLLDGVLVEAAE